MGDAKKREQRIRKYSSVLRNTPRIEEHSYYVSDKNKRIKLVSPLDVKYDGITYKERLKQLDDYINKNELLNSNVKACEERLLSILIDYGYNTPNIELNALIEDILKLNLIHPDKKYIGFKIKNEYIVGLGYDVILEDRELPEDIYNGYYQYLDGKIKVDSEKYHLYWGSLL